MKLLRPFKRNSARLVGPDVCSGPLQNISVSGTLLSFRCPRQTAMIPGFSGPEEFDLDIGLESDYHDPKNAYMTLYSSGWDFVDRAVLGSPYGGVTMKVNLGRSDEHGTACRSLFKSETIRAWISGALEATYGRFNREMWEGRDDYVDPITPEHSFWRYPDSPDNIAEKLINGRQWFHYQTYQPGYAPCTEFEAAITHRHVVRFSFTPSAYHGLDYFSPEHNVKQASEALIEELMSTVTIKLSPEAQRQLDEVQD